MAPSYVAARHLSEPAVKPLEKFSKRACALLARTQQKSSERGRKRQRVEGRDEHRDGNGNCELLVQQSFNAAHGRHGDEHG